MLCVSPASLRSFVRRVRPPHRLRSVYERLLGTEVEVQVVADTRAQAEAAERAGLDELERLTGVLSRFDPQSEFRRWLAHPAQRQPVSPDLDAVLAEAERWQHRSGGAFHPGADALGALWRRADETGRVPGEAELAAAVAELRAPLWTRHGDGTATPHATVPLGLNALAKGYVVDRVAETVAAGRGVRQVLVNAGGDLRVLGGRGIEVALADPRTALDNASPLARVRVRAALASSGGAHRGYQVGGRWYGHTLDPRTGQPVDHIAGVSVVAPRCMTADALATVLGVLGPRFELLDAHPDTAALVLTREGERHESPRWGALTSN